MYMDETVKELWRSGTYVTTIKHDGFKVRLFALNGEFYEVYYNLIEYKIIKVVQAAKDDLDKYLNKIKVDVLI